MDAPYIAILIVLYLLTHWVVVAMQRLGGAR